MGYRSTVAIMIGFETKEKLDAFLAPRLLQDHIKDYREYFSRSRHAPNQVLFYMEDAKWYKDYKFVQAITALYIEAEVAGGYWQYIRVGESPGDVEEDMSDNGNADFDDFYSVAYIETPATDKLTFGE